jgi:hypothetical protein
MNLVPPMDDEPPPEYVAFVTTHVATARRDAARLTGGDPEGTHLYMDALADVAGHWRRLTLLGRLRRTFASGRPPADTAEEYLARRLAARTRQWREDKIYDIDVRVLTEHHGHLYSRPPAASVALHKAGLLPDTVRSTTGPLADAAITWVQAYRRYFLRRVVRSFLVTIALLAVLIELVDLLATGS